MSPKQAPTIAIQPEIPQVTRPDPIEETKEPFVPVAPEIQTPEEVIMPEPIVKPVIV